MNGEELPLEEQRRRWRRYRKSLRLTDPMDPEFATGGLLPFSESQRVRFLVLPANTEALVVDFDDEFWAWWVTDRIHPASNRTFDWGHRYRPTSRAGVRYSPAGDEGFHHYLALHRSGALEFGLAGDAVGIYQGANVFKLVNIVGRVWSALDWYEEVIQKLRPLGPWEVSLALRDILDSKLGGVAEGWHDVDSIMYSPPVSQERSVLLKFEVHQWPNDPEEIQELSFRIGSWVENCWGVWDRRFLARTGNHKHQFDYHNLVH